MAMVESGAVERIFAQPGDLDELAALFPEAWTPVYEELQTVIVHATMDELGRRLTEANARWLQHAAQRAKALAQPDGPLVVAAATSRLRLLALEQFSRGMVRATVKPGRFGWVDRLLFRPLVRRAARAPTAQPLALHRARWKRLRHRPAAAAALYQSGCYCIFPRELVAGLAALIGPRRTLELGAGSGLLARYLAQAGVDITAIDDCSWQQSVTVGANVLREDAVAALSTRKPQVVLCSWPPPANRFEAQVFLTHSVELYIVLLSRHQHASGNWAEYTKQRSFDCTVAHELAALIHPPEVEGTVLVFSRKAREDKRRPRPG